ncbi:MAG: aminoacyl-tRNA hydrolase [Bacteroidales bacterium]|nr:aminoacyl-tRNA hydrolase [Anaerotignum sp.]MCI5679127.1 aminoacyl-tRNA hydrolase [Bacteroidales bacterium]MDY3926905.1 aminoacyl-tRNA hydrolase [Anaerotignum sp.]
MGLFDRFKNQESKGQEFFCIVGLGNPGRQYEETKHNVGFHVIDKLAKKYDIEVNKFKNKAFVGDGTIKGKRVLLVKPQTYMNLSGESVREIVNFYKIPQERFVVIFDDTSLPCGSVRIREKGSHGGHNGIRNIIDQMGTDEFNRIKVGIGEKPSGWDLADYVLAKFNPDDLPMMEQGMDKAVQGVELMLSRGIKEAANRVNQKAKTAKKQKEKEEAAKAEAEKKENEEKPNEVNAE